MPSRKILPVTDAGCKALIVNIRGLSLGLRLQRDLEKITSVPDGQELMVSPQFEMKQIITTLKFFQPKRPGTLVSVFELRAPSFVESVA